MNIYVGNLAWKTKRSELKELFENFGEVVNAFIVRDRETRRSRGFGFVEMAVEEEAREAIEKLNNTVFLDRTIIVNEARPKTDENGSLDDDSVASTDEQSKDRAEPETEDKTITKSADDASLDSDDDPNEVDQTVDENKTGNEKPETSGAGDATDVDDKSEDAGEASESETSGTESNQSKNRSK